MAEYKGIKGFKVQYLDQDPVPAVAGWTSGGNLGTARTGLAAAGIQTEALAFGGYISGPSASTLTEEYNGSTWTAGGALSTGRNALAGAGTQTAGLAIGGSPGASPYLSTTTEEYDGSSWTAGGSLPAAVRDLAGAGTQTAGLGFGGYAPSITTATNEYDGSTWTAGGAMNTARAVLAGCGTQTAGLAFGGLLPGVTAATEEYDGSTWTSNPTGLNTARRSLAGAGIQTSALAFGGYTTVDTGATEEYDGASWTTSPASLATARRSLGGCGTTVQALAFGGASPYTNATEEYNNYGEPNTFQNVGQVWYNGTTKALKFTNQSLVGTIATGGNMGSGRANHSAFGTATAGVAAGGFLSGSSPPVGNVKNATEEYDGTSWTSSGNMGTAQYRGFGGGTQTAGFVASGRVYTPAVAAKPATEEYDGSTWTTGGSLSTARYFGAQGSGPQTAGIATAGQSDPSTNFNATEEYNGTSWSGGGTLPFSGAATPGNGPQTSAIQAGGFTAVSPGTMTNSSNTYDGTSWTAVANINTARGQGGTLGDSSTATLIGGGPPSVSPISNSIENFDGTTWSANPNSLPATNIGYNNAGVGTQAAGYVAGGGSSPSATTYEFVGANVKGIKTVTVS